MQHALTDDGIRFGFDSAPTQHTALVRNSSTENSAREWREDERLARELHARAQVDERARHEAEAAADRDQERLQAVRLMLAGGGELGGLD